jgi:hypothetical protein
MAGPLTFVIGAADGAAFAAIAAQTRPIEGPRVVAGLAEALLEADEGWIWLVNASARPEPDALEELETVGDSGVRLLVSLPVGADGRPCDPALPAGAFGEVDRLVGSVAQGLVPIRHAAADSLLVDAEAARAAEPPDVARYGALATRAWTARLLRREPGYLVTASRVRVNPPAPDPVHGIARMARDRLWTPGDAARALSSRRRG